MSDIDIYIEFVNQQIAKFKKNSKLVLFEEISPPLINKALAEYTFVNLTLNSEYQRVKAEYTQLMDEYQEWWDKVFLEAKYKLNPLTLASGKWSSVKEIDATARYDNKEEYKEWRRKLRSLELKIAFYKRLLESWKNHKDILVNIAQNMRTEARALGIQDQANKKPETSRTPVQK